MFNKLIFGLFMFSLCCSAYSLSRATFATTSLADVILKSTYALENNPTLTSNCFLIYMPQITELTNQYEEAYNGCLNISAAAETNLKMQVQNDIDNIENISNDMCSNFKSCSNNTDLYNIFECYYNVANNTRESAFNIEKISKDKMQYVKITEEYIAYNERTCTDKCSQIYQEELTIAYTNLELCLAGKPPKDSTPSTIQPDKNHDEDTTVATEKSETTTVDIVTAPLRTTTVKDSDSS